MRLLSNSLLVLLAGLVSDVENKIISFSPQLELQLPVAPVNDGFQMVSSVLPFLPQQVDHVGMELILLTASLTPRVEG